MLLPSGRACASWAMSKVVTCGDRLSLELRGDDDASLAPDSSSERGWSD